MLRLLKLTEWVGGNTEPTDRNERFVVRLCATYCRRILHRYPRIDRPIIEFLAWVLGPELEQLAQFLVGHARGEARDDFREALEECTDVDDCGREICKLLGKQPASLMTRLVRFVLDALGARIEALADRGKPEVERNLARVRQMLGLTEKEAEFCFFVYVIGAWSPVETYFENHLQVAKPSGRKYLQEALAVSAFELQRTLTGKVKSLGMMEEYNAWYRLEAAYLSLFQESAAAAFSRGLFRKAPRNVLPLEYHLVDAAVPEHILTLLKHRPDGSATHILIYGPAGTGKTSFARGLARKLGVPTYEILKDAENKAQTQRLGITACLNMTNGGDALIIVDEADRVLNTESAWFVRGETQDKGWLNQLLEQPGVRMIWIANRIDDIDESVRRRFAFSVHLRPFGKRQRIQIWERVAQRNKVKALLTPEEITTLAGEYQLTAGAVDLAVRKAKASGTRDRQQFLAALRLGLEAHRTLLNDGERVVNREQLDQGFSLEGLNIDGDLDAVMSQLDAFDRYLRQPAEGQRRLNLNLLFYGPPGTGKSELARYVARRLDREVMVRRASDLLDPYVGMTERRLAQAFAQAEREESVLVVDEADSFLFSRDRAEHSWETSFTNEFLTQMERFRGILICTTNRLTDLDSASVRRFNQKVRFDFLTPDGNVVFYRKLLAPLVEGVMVEEARRALAGIGGLAPGDFRVVRDRFALLTREVVTHEAMIDALVGEARVRQQQAGGRVAGFVA